jgi:AcrR family transcriptional regulator
MGINERRIREKAERKAMIKRCAKELILEKGAEKVSMMNIAQRAELSKATLYLYFPSKDMLFNEICREAATQFLERFRAGLAPGLSAVQTLRLFWQCYLDMFGESEDMVILFTMKHYLAPNYPFIPIEKDSQSPFGSNYEFFAMIRDLISQGIAEGFFEPEVNADMVARTILSLFSYVVENAARQPKTSRKFQFIIDEISNLFQIIFRGIARSGVDASYFALPKQAAGNREPEQ